MKFIILLLFSFTITRGQECSDGLLIAGGENEGGILNTLHLLTSSGWCDKVNLPSLPEPLSDPAVYVKHSKVVICGFSVIPCRYAEPGSTEWIPMHWVFNDNSDDWPITGPNETNYNIVGAFDSLLMTTTSKQSSYQGRTYQNPLRMEGFPPNETLSSWQEYYGSPFGFERRMDGSCLVAVDTNTTDPSDITEVLLTGAYGKHENCGPRCDIFKTDPVVARWSKDGNAGGDGPPDWETGVVDDMLFAREDHGCVGYMGGVLVSGGADFQSIRNPVSPVERISMLQSTEFWNGKAWQEVGDLLEARMDFKMKKFCGNVVAVGGRQYDLHQSLFLDTMEILEGNGINVNWGPSDFRLPNPMAKFGMAEVSNADQFCET